MSFLKLRSPAEQVARHLRDELARGTWSGEMPGTPLLAEELGVDRKTITGALRLLEAEGLLVSQGPGRRRRIRTPDKVRPTRLRLALFVEAPADRRSDYMIDLQHELTKAGHHAFHPQTYLAEVRTDLHRIERVVRKVDADAWVVSAGSRDVLKWFIEHGVPAFALFGRRRGLPIASVGPNKAPAMTAAVRRLVEFGHRRIVLLARSLRRLPGPGEPERAFLGELQRCGIPPGPYHLPDWEESIDGFRACLESLFRYTAPTALIVDEAAFYVATQQFLGNQGLRVPEDVSLVCTDADPHFDWCRPSVAHIRWDSRSLVRRIVRWAENVSRGKDDRRQTQTKAEFVEGGTIGPAKG